MPDGKGGRRVGLDEEALDVVPAALYVLDDLGERSLQVGEDLRGLLGNGTNLDRPATSARRRSAGKKGKRRATYVHVP